MRKIILILIACLMCATAPAASRLVLVRGTGSAPNEAEKSYARSVTLRLSRWLSEAGLVHDVINDEQVGPASLGSAKVVILGYNPSLLKAELAAIRSFVVRGGRVIVFYSSDPNLATLLDMKLGAYKASDALGTWRGFRFNASAPGHLPGTVRQESRNIRPVYPVSKKARIIAVWENASAQATGDPAWVLSERGAWMSHVLLDDGDTRNKKRMLLGLIGHYDAAAWAPAAKRYMEEAGKLGGYADFQAAREDLARRAGYAANPGLAQELLSEATALNAELVRLMQAEKYADVVDRSNRVRDFLMEVYGSVQKPEAGEFRGVWDHAGTGLYPGDWGRTCRVLKEHGMTDIFQDVSRPGVAHYNSKLFPVSKQFALYGDQLNQSLAAAHPLGLRVHAWKICWKLEGASPEFIGQLEKQGRLQVTDAGKTIPWLCPSNVENVRMEKDAIREIVSNYDVDGIHLDYIRYPDSRSCYCVTCRRNFETDTKSKPARWPEDVRSGPMKATWYRWRCDQMTRLVRDVGALARGKKPGIKVSAAVFGKYPSCVDAVGQDWVAWLKEGYLDFVCPMNYAANLARFEEFLQGQLDLVSAKRKIIPGIGVTALESRLDAAQVIDQIVALRKRNVQGFVLFDLNRVLEKEILPILSLGLTASVGELGRADTLRER